MKKFINISLIAGILCLFFGTGLFFVGRVMGGGKVVKKLDFSSMLTTDSNNLEKEYAILEKTKIDDFDKINVKLNTIDFKIAKSDDKNCYISYNLKKEKGEVTAEYEVSDGEFKLRQKSNHVTVNMDLSGIEALISGTKDYTQRNQFILYLPEAKQIGSAELDMAEGDISVDRLRSDRIDISVDAGDIKLLDTESKEIKIASSDGDMSVKDSKLNTVTINDSYGDIKFEDTDIDSGKITIDGNDITKVTRDSLRRAFAMVLQDTWLFKGSIMENIRYGRLDATDEEVIAAAKAARAHHFIQTLPGGYQMELNEDASNVSQGQKQLLTIARAILADNKILILDEATSSVDTRTEIEIQKAMDNLMKGRTSFIIAHRLSTIRDADLILVMKDGDIIEQGNHEELLAKNGFYANLYNSQFEDVVA